MGEREARIRLKELGLNEYEVRAYLTLLKNGPLTAGELATLSKVPQPRIYDVIRTLMAKGFITTTPGRPMRIIPLSPEKVIEAIRKRYNERLEKLKGELERIYTPHREVGSVRVIKSSIAFEEHLEETIENAKYHLSIVLPISLLTKAGEKLRKKKAEDVVVHLFVYGSGEVPSVANEIRIREVPDPILVIQDRETGIYLPYEALGSGTSLQGYGLIIRDNHLLFILDRYFYHALWPTGRVVHREERKLELPREYIHIRDLVDDIRKFGLRGARVEVFGRFVRSGVPVHITGKIVDFFENESRVISNITVETDKGQRYVVGGWNASLEDVEAERIILLG